MSVHSVQIVQGNSVPVSTKMPPRLVNETRKSVESCWSLNLH